MSDQQGMSDHLIESGKNSTGPVKLWEMYMYKEEWRKYISGLLKGWTYLWSLQNGKLGNQMNNSGGKENSSIFKRTTMGSEYVISIKAT